MRPSTFVFIGLGLLTLARFLMIGAHELQEDEAYYALWADRLAPSYYSKGPGVAAIIAAGTGIFGPTEFGVRFFSPLIALGTSLILFRLGRSLFDEMTAAWAILVLNVSPIFTAGSMLMTIDAPFVFFWVAAMWCFWRALLAPPGLSGWWPAAGLMMGMGFLCKYTILLQLLSILLLLLWVPRWRRQLFRPGFYLMLLVMLACTTPVWIWNAGNGWVTVRHLIERGSLDEQRALDIGQVIGFVVGQAIVYSPLIYLAIVWAVVVSLRQARGDKAVAFLLAFALPVLALYYGLSLRESGEANWTVPGMAAGGLLLAYQWRRVELPPVWATWWRGATVGLGAALSLALIQTDLLRQLGVTWAYQQEEERSMEVPAHLLGDGGGGWRGPLAGVGDPSRRMRGWREGGKSLGELVRVTSQELGEPVFLVANRWQVAAALAFYLDDELPVLRPAREHPEIHAIQRPFLQHQFSFWPRYDEMAGWDEEWVPGSEFVGRSALYVTDQPASGRPPDALGLSFAECRAVAVFDVMRAGYRVRRLKVFLCYDYRPVPL